MFYLANIDSLLTEFGVDWPMFIAQVINFVFVAFLIYRFGFKGVLSTMQEREKQISDSLKHAETIKLELEEILSTQTFNHEICEDSDVYEIVSACLPSHP